MVGRSVVGSLLPVGVLCVLFAALVACGDGGGQGDDADEGPGRSGDAGNDEMPDASGAADAGDDGATIPCDVVDAFVDNCKRCHGPMPAGGAPSLTSHARWHARSPHYDATKKIFEVAKIRIEKGEMPQGATLSTADRGVLDAWLSASAPSGGAEAESCQVKLTDDSASSATGAASDECARADAFEPLVARDGETCHELRVHGEQGEDDTTKFEAALGEHYHEFYYAVPWEQGDVWTRFGADFDNLQILHHYLVFANNANGKVPGQVDRNVAGTTLFSNSTLIGGWAVGGCARELPEDVGGQLPQSNLIMVQWHMYNYTDGPQLDGSIVQVCTVPEGTRPNTAGITFLGTESLNMGPGRNDFTSRCTNNSGGDVTLLGFTPHMHTIGLHMKTELEHAGSVDTIFDQPFQFDYQVGYQLDPQVTVKPGDTLITTCSFLNDTGMNVGFGQSTKQEMCYQYVAYYPAGALNNGVFSLIGATNTCW